MDQPRCARRNGADSGRFVGTGIYGNRRFSTTSPGYVGTIQFAYTLALSPYAISSATAFAASVFYHALAYFSVFFVGLYYLHRSGYSLGQVRSEAETARHSVTVATQSVPDERS